MIITKRRPKRKSKISAVQSFVFLRRANTGFFALSYGWQILFVLITEQSMQAFPWDSSAFYPTIIEVYCYEFSSLAKTYTLDVCRMG